MTPQQESLLEQVLVEMSALRKEVTTINKALAYKTTAVKKQESVQDIANSIIAETILKAKQNRHN
jgi:hypothetical protein